MKTKYIMEALAALLLTSCNDFMGPQITFASRGETPARKRVCGFDLSLIGAGTKAGFLDDESINFVNVFVYDENGDIVNTSKSLTYMKASSFGLQFPNKEEGDESTYNIYFLANTDYIDPKSEEYGFLSKESGISMLSIPFDATGSMGFGVPAATAIYDYRPDGGTTAVQMRRLVAKYKISFDRSELKCATFTLKNLEVKNLASTLHPFDDALGERAADATPSRSLKFSGRAESASEIISNGDGVGSESGSIVFYVPENCQGTLESGSTVENTSGDRAQYKKRPSKNAELCTYLELTCDVQLPTLAYTGNVYRFYLGGDAISDYSIRRNTTYEWVYKATNWQNADGVDEFDWFVEVGDTKDVTTDYWFAAHPSLGKEDALDKVYSASFVSTTVYARTDNPLIPFKVSGSGLSGMNLSVSDVDECTKKIVITTSLDQSTSFATSDPSKDWDNQSSNTYSVYTLNLTPENTIIKSKASLPVRVIRGPLGVVVGAPNYGSQALGATGGKEDHNLGVNISEPFGLIFSSDESSSISGYSHMLQFVQNFTGWTTAHWDWYEDTYDLTYKGSEYIAGKCTRIAFNTPDRLLEMQEELVNGHYYYNSTQIALQLCCWNEMCLLYDDCPQTYLNPKTYAFRGEDTFVCSCSISIPCLYRTNALLGMGNAKSTLSTTIRSSSYSKNSPGYKYLEDNFGGDMASFYKSAYSCYSLISGKTIQFKYLKNTYDIYLESNNPYLTDYHYPAVITYRPGPKIQYQRTLFHIKELIDEKTLKKQSYNPTGSLFAYREDCPGKQAEFFARNKGKATVRHWAIPNNRSEHYHDVENAEPSEKNDGDQFDLGLWNHDANGRFTKYPDHPFVWELTDQQATLKVNGSEQSTGYFTVSTQ